MYKRRRRRTGCNKKGKKKEIQENLTTASISPTSCGADAPSSPSTSKEITTTKMSVTESMEVTGVENNNNNNHQTTELMMVQPRIENKAVGARKRKTTPIAKIVENRLPSPIITSTENENGVESGNEELTTEVLHNNNNNSPPYKKSCVESRKNGMIRSIVTELKTKAKEQASSKLDLILNLNSSNKSSPYYKEEDGDDEDEKGSLQIKEDTEGDDEDDGDCSQEDVEERKHLNSGNEIAKLIINHRKRHGSQQQHEKSENEKEDEDIVSMTNVKSHKNNSSEVKRLFYPGCKMSNGWPVESRNWDREARDEDGEEESEEEDRGTDLRRYGGRTRSSGAEDDDDELPFKCGVCSYGSCDKSTLLRHMRTHSGERPFQCRLCFFAFTTKANCERHLRNRHGQIDKDQVRNLVVCLPTSSNASESETETTTGDNSTGAAIVTQVNLQGNVDTIIQEEMSNKSHTNNNNPSHLLSKYGSPMSYISKENNKVIDLTKIHPIRNFMSVGINAIFNEDELPLDLSMDAVDLSTKHRETSLMRQTQNRVDLLRPRPLYPLPEMSNPLLTSPFVTKREPTVHPQLPINQYTAHSLRASDLNGTHPLSIVPPTFSLFPVGAPSGYNPFLIPPSNVNTNAEKLIGIAAGSPSKISNLFSPPSPTASFCSSEGISSIPMKKETKSDQEDEKRNDSHANSSSVSSASPTSGSRKRSEKKSNGEYQKPKQRRYRTERPFACPHCPARFTLRSNMERHGKHQHPTVWQRSPSNRVINRQKNQQSPLVGSPTLVPQPPSKYITNGISIDTQGRSRETSTKLPKNEKHNNIDVRAVIAQQLKRKISNSSIRIGNGKTIDLEKEPCENRNKGDGEPSDLASVSQLLDGVKSSSFAQYFAEPENRDDGDGSEDEEEESKDGDEEERDDGRSSTEDGYEDEVEEGDSKHEHDSSGGEKKKSAYSSAPHKISCPHCTRRFPWTSSLRRHLLTHTGQKPFQCSQCSLFFTTKSNCDRHLARKHSRGMNLKISEENSAEEDDEEDQDEVEVIEHGVEEDEEGNQSSQPQPQDILIKTPVRNSIKTSTSVPNGTSSGEDVSFRCHLCEASASERDVLLAHMEEDHKETFHMLVSKGALSSPPQLSENSENEQLPCGNLDVTHRKVICVFCVRRFWSVEDLRRHIRSHSGERPFSCPHCSRRFTLKHSMLRHLKKHSSESQANTSVCIDKDKKEYIGSINVKNKEKKSGSNNNGTDLIGRLLGIKDKHLVEQLLSKPNPKSAAKLLGLRVGRPITSVTTLTKT